MTLVARGLLSRYPRLRSAWPVRQASAWRQRREWRTHPRRMASWYRDAADMRTRLIVSNLEVPDAPSVCHPASIAIELMDADGARLASKRLHLARNASA